MAFPPVGPQGGPKGGSTSAGEAWLGSIVQLVMHMQLAVPVGPFVPYPSSVLLERSPSWGHRQPRQQLQSAREDRSEVGDRRPQRCTPGVLSAYVKVTYILSP